ncbi:YdeI family protein [uncultured Ramlibacter sp.]|uniref:YdeI/OmpD-associated family protein n=1 Tax=uncultured Ramlibacter sp. TaxID=260755 RepID=UPI002601B184|nr:YdeI/OmpD-associated family protein [uncultured Ramlibacter sp.]
MPPRSPTACGSLPPEGAFAPRGGPSALKPARFFETPAQFRAWLTKNAKTATELVVGFHKKDSGRPSMSWSESVDEALCVGWIDGVRKRIDATSYQIRFTPRKPGSVWSAINIAKVAALEQAGRMKAAGRKAFAARSEAKSRIYSFEQAERLTELPPALAAVFRKHKEAWAFFQAQPPGYRHQMLWRVLSAKRETTQAARLDKLIAASQAHSRL